MASMPDPTKPTLRAPTSADTAGVFDVALEIAERSPGAQ